MTIFQIKCFLEVGKYLNFTKAAESLYTSQPSITKHVLSLENELNLQLFIRTKHYVRFTPAGKMLYKEFQDILNYINIIIDKATRISLDMEGGELNIGCLEVLNTDLFLPLILKKFTERYSNINLSFESHSFKALRHNLINGKLDIVFTLSFSLADLSNLQHHSVYKAEVYIAIPRSHPLADKKNLNLSDFKEDIFIVTSQDDSPEGIEFIEKLCNNYGFLPKKYIQAPTLQSQILSLESSLGISILDSSLRTYKNKNIRFIKINNKDAVVNVNAVWRKDNTNPSLALFSSVLPD